jgi:probable addiction module antidote protein
METLTVTKWNLADEIETKEDVAGIIEAALEENDAAFLFKVIGDIARSKGMAQIARELGLNRESLYVALSPEGNPSFTTVSKVLNVLGFQLSIRPRPPPGSR